MDTYRILVIDDDLQVRGALQTLLERNKYVVSVAATGKEGLKQVQRSAPDMVLSDIMMPEMDGIEMLQKLKELDPDLPVILMTGYSSIEGAIRAIRYGADEYLTKPLDQVEVLHIIEKTRQQQRLTQQNKMMRQLLAQRPQKELIGESQSIKQVKQAIAKSARSNISVLVLGESGTGKELISEAIHAQSDRAEEAFVAINCAAIPNDLLESELFGHEKGAFSGATARKYGLFEMANQGTLFLDEIGEMSLPLQAKIL
ncbi:MAG: sigma-54 dependent transcriptional regulator, partial [Candidatus Marinimicrobia bacterium]|nr:sigma-54 dependent transcriptional regulator [Candidatus Neomarinimicrobiota bacterium]